MNENEMNKMIADGKSAYEINECMKFDRELFLNSLRLKAQKGTSNERNIYHYLEFKNTILNLKNMPDELALSDVEMINLYLCYHVDME